MSTAYTIVSIVGAVLAGFSSGALALRARFVTDSLTAYRVPRSWWPWLATAKAAGGVGLLVGLWVPVIGVLAGAGLVLYFTGAVVTVVRARWYSHVPVPLIYLAPAAASLVLAAVA
ncbi:MAG TPA: DoxX family protein [Actinophytocola sp.]|jgi:hypothetical protein|uniref:DoxX family protein n=1 Tax=Actinophytocola sp. TaxID=1872138 RepID=UPI002F95201D